MIWGWILRLLPGLSSALPWLRWFGLFSLILSAFSAGAWLGHRVTQGGEVRALAETVEQQERNLREYEDRLQQREQQRQEAQRQADQWKQRWENDKRNDPETDRWQRTPLPGPVRERMRELADASNPAARGAPSHSYTLPRMPRPRTDQWGNVRLPCSVQACARRM